MSFNISWRRFEYSVGALISLFTFLFYYLTLCPTVNFIDSGELSAVACTLGIAHPTGYPLFSIVGWIFAHLPLGMRTIYQLNLMSAFFCAAGLFFFFRFIIFFLSEFFFKDRKRFIDKNENLRSVQLLQIFIPSAFATLILGFSETYWSQALSIEVYSLHVFFLSLILLLFTKAIQLVIISQKYDSGNKVVLRYWYCFAFVLGLSFTNHMTTILLTPAFIYLYFYVHGFTRRAWQLSLWLIIPFIIGFSVYLYLPLRGSQQPIFNWGNPIDLERFFWHFSGRVYRAWIFTSTESAVKQFNYFVTSLGDEFAYFPLAFAVIGVVSLFKYRKVVLVFTLLLFFGCIFYSINYDIHDIDSYFLLAYITIALWVGAGASKVVSYIKNLRSAIIVAIIIIISSFIPIFSHYNQVDESKNFIVEDYTMNMLKYIGTEGIIICYQWDYFISASYYLKVVEGVRPDVVIIDKELLKRSWYYDQLSNHYPWLVERSIKEIQDFLKELYKFEHNKPFDPNVIEYYYERVIKSIIVKNYSTRSIYATQEIEQKYTRDYNRIPSGLAFRLYNDKILHEIPQMEINFREPKINNIYVDGIKSLYAQAYMNNAIYLNMLGRKDNALLYLDKAIQIQPNYEQAIHLKDQLTR